MIKVLVTNDDGIDAPGIRSLTEALAPLADVYVAAPMTQKSAKSQGVTFLREVDIEERDFPGAAAAWAVNGTPADCVKLGLVKLAEEGIRPDYIFSGINMGLNAGLAAYYSGTIAAAREGALNGIHSIALSVGDHEAKQFGYITGMLPRLMEMASATDARTLISVNAPELPAWDVRGVKIVPAAPFGYGELYEFHPAESGGYQLGSVPAPVDDRKRYDFDWVREGYVTISPIGSRLDDPAALMQLRGQMISSECLAVIVDAQEGALPGLRKPRRFARSIERFAHAASRMDIPILLTETYGLGGLIPEIEPYIKNAEHVVHLQTDAWASPDMEKHVKALGAATVLVAGGATNVAVMQAAEGFIERGFSVTILEDCCTAASKKEHRLAAESLREAGCSISTCETELMKIAGRAERAVCSSVIAILSS